MKRMLHKVMNRARKQHKRQLSFLKALRLFEGMPLLGIRR